MVPDEWVGASLPKLLIQGIQCNDPRRLKVDERFERSDW